VWWFSSKFLPSFSHTLLPPSPERERERERVGRVVRAASSAIASDKRSRTRIPFRETPSLPPPAAVGSIGDLIHRITTHPCARARTCRSSRSSRAESRCRLCGNPDESKYLGNPFHGSGRKGRGGEAADLPRRSNVRRASRDARRRHCSLPLLLFRFAVMIVSRNSPRRDAAIP